MKKLIIRFDRKVRRIVSFCIVLAIILGSVVVDKSAIATSKMQSLLYKISSDTKNANSSNEINLSSLNEYNIVAEFDDENKKLNCTQITEYTNTGSDSIDKVYFHIYPNAFSKKEFAPFEESEMKLAYPRGFNEGYIKIEKLFVEDKEVDYKITGDKNDILQINLQDKLKKKDSVNIKFKYIVKLPNSLGRFGYGENTVNVTNWFPIACVQDQRGWNLKSYTEMGDPFYSETSNFKINITVPKEYKLAYTGILDEEKKSTETTLYKISAKKVRDFAFVMSKKFTIATGKVKGVEIDTYNLNKNMAEKATEVSEDAISIFSDLFGKYPYKKYSVVASDFYIGGMEYPMLSMIDKSMYTESNRGLLEYVIAHETAHQWWYSVVGNDEISEPWLDEALTEYSTLLYFEEKYGKKVADRMFEEMKEESKDYKAEDIFRASTDYSNSVEYSMNVYTKGAIAIGEIREKVGNKKFFSTLREYFEDNKYKNANAKTFVDLWEKNGVDVNKIISEIK
ncbi:MAG: M1 family metallopeptidase [Clostridioides sp.]|nr:M1 family metallopeptidase [Clostridioides sp.]